MFADRWFSAALYCLRECDCCKHTTSDRDGEPFPRDSRTPPPSRDRTHTRVLVAAKLRIWDTASSVIVATLEGQYKRLGAAWGSLTPVSGLCRD